MFVQTVLNAVEPWKLGRTLTHEHLKLDYSLTLVQPPKEVAEYLQGPITLENVGFVQRYPYSNAMNLQFNDDEAVLYDVGLYKKHGGGTIVENTTHGIHRNASFLKELSKTTGVHIVAGTGFYIAQSQTAADLKFSVEDIYNLMKKELFEGCKENGEIRCGFLGEIAVSHPFAGDGFELRSIQATGELQAFTKCPVSFHPGRDPGNPEEIMRRFTEAGGDDRKAVMSHLDRTVNDSQLLEFADLFQCYLQHDLFGTEMLTYQFAPDTQMPSDAQRIARIRSLIEHGFKDRTLMSHDIHTRNRLVKYGGHGYSHININILPKLRFLGVPDDVIDGITIDNPQNWLASCWEI